MTTTTLSSKKRFGNLLFGMLKKNISIAVYLLIIIFIFFPLQMILETRNVLGQIASLSPINDNIWRLNLASESGLYTSVSSLMMVGLLLMAVVIVGLVQCSYLHNKRAVDLYHSLPVSRVQLLCAGMITSFTTVMVPFFANWLINLGVVFYRVNAIAGLGKIDPYGLPVGEFFWDIFGWSVTIFAVLAVVFFVATQVGSVFEHFVFVCEILLAPAAIVLVNNIVFDAFLTGFSANMGGRQVSAFSPATFMAGRIFGTDSTFYNWLTIAWLVLGVGILLATLALYNRRKSELAETSGCKGILGLLLSLIAVYVISPAMGSLFMATSGSENFIIYVVGVLIGSVLVFLLLSAILNRGFSGIRKKFPQGIAICALVTAFAVIATTGGMGFENRVPNPANVKSVTLDYRGWYDYTKETTQSVLAASMDMSNWMRPASVATLSDPEAVDAITKLHRSLIPTNQLLDKDASHTQRTQFSNQRTSMAYHTTTGKLERGYNVASIESLALFAALEEIPAFQQATNPLLRVDPNQVGALTLHNDLGFLVEKIGRGDSAKDALLTALQADALKNGTRDFSAGSPIRGYVWVQMADLTDADRLAIIESNKNVFRSFSVPIFDSYTNTMALLRQSYPTALVQGNADEITDVGFDTYYFSRSDSNLFVSQVAGVDSENHYDSRSQDYRSLSQSYFAELVKGRVNFGRDTGSHGYVFCTLYRGDERGATFLISAENMPEAMRQELPDLYQSVIQNSKWHTADDGNSISVIGGADGPTAVFVSDNKQYKNFSF